MASILKEISKKDLAISEYDFLGEEFDALLGLGLFGVVMCPGGEYTSGTVVRSCFAKNIPVVKYKRGYVGLAQT